MKLVVFLQNAWSPAYAGTVWPREPWLAAMWRSRSGNKVSKLVRGFDEYWIDNTTPICGDTPSSVVMPDHKHIRQILIEQDPGVVVTCGRQAAYSVGAIWSGSLLVIPHPACRIVTNALYDRANRMLRRGFSSRAELLQMRGSVKRVNI